VFSVCFGVCSRRKYGIALAIEGGKTIGAVFFMKHVHDEAILLLWIQVVTGTMGLYFLAHLVAH
jgi:hypothetical protein